MTKSKSFFYNLVKPFKLKSTKETQDEELEQLAAQEQKIFKFQTLISATKNFHPDNKLGEGGYGPVFKVTIILFSFQLIEKCIILGGLGDMFILTLVDVIACLKILNLL
ncbi:putative non-specific serine/threonine protein kinase [Helianthus annuus]|nr:putative non-specific serine/threonine protein kinase [Helianthus annuus]